MAFVPLSYKNFIVNKVNNVLKVNYKNSDISSHLCNKVLDSKSLININNFNNLSDEECQLASNDVDLVSKKNTINSFYTQVSKESLTASDYFEAKSLLNNINIYNENIKDFNFKNYYSINRVEQRFLPNSFELQKKNATKRLYHDYNSNYSLDYYKNLKQGFCNYSTINFFSRQYDDNINHSNCIVWPNTKTSTGNLSDIFNNSFAISCYINLRRNYSNHDQPECLLHIPDLLSLYIVKSTDSSSNDKHRVIVTTGASSIKNINEEYFNIDFNSSSEHLNTNTYTYVSSGLNIFNNRWYNICLNFNKSADKSSHSIELYLDGSSITTVDIPFVKNIQNTTNSFICLGNKPNYKKDDDTYITNFDEVFYQFFGLKLNNTNQKISGPLTRKDINLGKNTFWNDNDENLSIDSISDNYVKFESLKSNNSESFHGEIHDIRIYTQNLSEDKILYNCSNTIDSISKEIDDYSLSFYVPVFYIPAYVDKYSFVNVDNNRFNLKFSNLYNPYFANFCGGLEVSSENYLLDFVNNTKPNIVIGGSDSGNIYDDETKTSLTLLVDSQSDVLKIKKGVLGQSIYNANISDTSHNNFNNNNVVQCNLSYRNLLILPNDNGIPKVNFNIINDILVDLDYDSNKVSDDVFHISTENIFNVSDFHDNLNYSSFLDSAGSFNIQLDNNEEYEFVYTKDRLFNLSNIIYHDTRINNMKTLSSDIDDESFANKLDSINTIFSITSSNPVLRNYTQDAYDFNITALTKTNTKINDIDHNYIKFPIPYASANKNYDCLFNTIFDISSKMYNKKINKKTFKISDSSILTTNSKIKLKFSDDGYGTLYRDDCLTKVAKWNYVGHIFYCEGLVSLNRPELSYFGASDFECEFTTDNSMFVHEINIPAAAGTLNTTINTSYDESLRHDESAFNSESKFVYITDINLHDENLNVVAKAKLARPAPKKNEDNILFKLKMDY